MAATHIMSLTSLTFLNTANIEFISELFLKFTKDKNSVDISWRDFFENLDDDAQGMLQEITGASWAPQKPNKFADAASEGAGKKPVNGTKEGTKTTELVSPAAAQDSLRAQEIVNAYRQHGHLNAKLDPLGLARPQNLAELSPAHYGLQEADLDRQVFVGGLFGLQEAPLRDVLTRLEKTYCGSLGVEYMHIQDSAQLEWLQNRFESGQNVPAFDKDTKKHTLQRLTAAESFEKFLQVKFPGTKRFGLEGGETMIPALETAIARGVATGLSEVVVGMAHRGRLNVLTNLLSKAFTAMFSEFQGTSAYPDSVQGSGDVKYHLGTSTDREFAGKILHLTMNANPSHLEFVNPVVSGRVRAKQQQRSGGNEITDAARREVMGIQIHGDAAFAGQGVVAETLMLSELKGYTTGGTFHFVINNQVGFTTSPQYSRSGVYCSDVAKMIQAPIFHVNGDDVEAVLLAVQIAMDFRQTFHKDVVIDMVCYRRHGHNESDEPAFTQPIMYQTIKALPTTRDVYASKLVAEGSLSQIEADKIQSDFLAKLENDFQAATGYKPNKADWLEGRWLGMAQASGDDREGDTGIDLAKLREVGNGLASVPAGFNVNPKIAKQLEAKKQMMDSGEGIDWATAEALAFGTLMTEGTPIRLSGQDCGRGTFSQRHSVLYDQNNENRHVPLNALSGKKAAYEVIDSPLSELAVMGFDYGYSLAEPNALVCWEGQFGDFSNGAQVLIDQFISSSESKWLRMSGLVLLLPHGYEGQGPEHSSARLERYLQLCGEDNWQVANCSTPANYFHILRRQIKRNFRKPLVLMTPKSLLRHKLCVSKLDDMAKGTHFMRVIPDTTAGLEDARKIKRVVLCSGKLYYDLLAAREEKKIKDVALVRLEQFYPYPDKLLQQELGKYPKAEIVWCQEEPENMGAWRFLDRRIEGTLTAIGHKAGRPKYVGRSEAASPAAGSLKKHTKEQNELIDKALL